MNELSSMFDEITVAIANDVANAESKFHELILHL
jgi:hypothetical protein